MTSSERAGVMFVSRPHTPACTAVDDVDIVDMERDRDVVGHRHTRLGRCDITYPTAHPAHEVMVGGLDIGINPNAAGTEVEQTHLTERLEIVHGLVHGAPRDRGHRLTHGIEQRVDRGVALIGDEQADDPLPLRRDAHAAGVEFGGDHLDAAHRTKLSTPRVN